jgi:hypothetical protein
MQTSEYHMTHRPVLWLVLILIAAAIAPASAFAQTQPATRPAEKIKVGIVVSLFTATGPSWAGAPYGFSHADPASDFDDAERFELYAVVDPGTQDDEQVREAVAKYFPEGQRDRLIDGSDAKQLGQLHAIVARRTWNAQGPVLDAIAEAVRVGVGFVNVGGIGAVTPGYTPVVLDLVGMTDAQYAFHPRPLAAEVLEKDLIPPELLAQPAADAAADGEAGPVERPDGAAAEGAAAEGAAAEEAAAAPPAEGDLMVNPNGSIGTLKEGTAPLIKLTDSTQLAVPRPKPDGVEFYPLLVADLGKGRIIVCNMSTPAEPLKRAADGKFYRRCVESILEARQ